MDGRRLKMDKSIFHDIQQNTDEWMKMKLGKFSASMTNDLFSGKSTKDYNDAITNVAFERITGKRQKQFSNKWMDYGHETEPEALENYEIETFNRVSNGGIYILNEWVCASPDGGIEGQNGGVEFKCPAVSTYRDYLEQMEKFDKVIIPKNYELQMQFQMYVSGFEFVDYMPYYDSSVKQILARVNRDEGTQIAITLKLNEAIRDVQDLMIKIKR